MGDMTAKYAAGLIDQDGNPIDEFDVPDGFSGGTNGPETPRVGKADPLRPEAIRGRYYIEHPETGKRIGWRRVTNFVKAYEDTYHLELWKQRNVALGLGLLIQSGRLTVDDLASLHVKADKTRLNNIVNAALDAAEAYRMANEGTALHKSSEQADFAGGDLNRVSPHHRAKIALYLDALAVHGLRVADNMIERVVVSTKYNVVGKFDRVMHMQDDSHVMLDVKTNDSLDMSLPSIAGQLDCYVDGINTHGVYAGPGLYDTRIKVREDFALVLHLPSTRDEVSVQRIKLAPGRRVNEANMNVFDARKVKAAHVAELFPAADGFHAGSDTADQYWLEQLNAGHTRDALVDVARRARLFGHWNTRLAGQARLLASSLDTGMGS